MSDYVRIFDTTLRDGEQSPGATMTSGEKLEASRALSRLGVDIIEAGFPAASPDDLRGVQNISKTVGREPVDGRPSEEPPTICALARASRNDIDRAWEGVRQASKPRIHTFIATSPIHREYKLRMSGDEIIAKVKETVAYAASLCDDIEFSPEDAGRTEPEFLHKVLKAAVAAGARTLNIPDTVGYTAPEEFGALIHGICSAVAADDVIVSVHCHDDLGLATANTLAGLRAGARQAEVTINGIGERAGNAALEEVVMALRTRGAHYGLRTGVDASQLARVSRLISTCTGISVQPNKAIVGANAFAHEAGIHQDGMLKHKETYEIMTPETVGVSKTELVLGKHSGRHAFMVRLTELGYSLPSGKIDLAFDRFKELADRKKYITDSDLEALLASEFYQPREFYSLDGLQVACGSMSLATATVRLRTPDGKMAVEAAVGTGPVDATYKAINAIVKPSTKLLEFNVHSVTGGIDALGDVSVHIGGAGGGKRVNPQSTVCREPVFRGNGAHTDIVVASAKAYLAALNRLLAARAATTTLESPAAKPRGPKQTAVAGEIKVIEKEAS